MPLQRFLGVPIISAKWCHQLPGVSVNYGFRTHCHGRVRDLRRPGRPRYGIFVGLDNGRSIELTQEQTEHIDYSYAGEFSPRALRAFFL